MTPKQLKKWRDKHELTQPQLAELLGVDPVTVSRWERDVQKIPPFLYLALETLRRNLQKPQ